MAKLGSFCNTVVDKTFAMKQSLAQSRKSLYWAFLNLFLAFIFYSDLFYHRVGILGHYSNTLVIITESLIAGLLSLNLIVDIFRYIWPRFMSAPVVMSDTQRRLLGVKPWESGFRTDAPETTCSPTPDTNPIFNTSVGSGHIGYSSGSTSPVSGASTPAWIPSPYSMRDVSFSPDLARTFSPASFNNTFSSSLNNSTSFRSNRSSISPSVSPWATREVITPSGLRSRHVGSPLSRLPVSPGERITDEQSLNRFLRDEEVKQYKTALTSPDAVSHAASFWTRERSVSDYTRVLRRYEYQIASRSSQSALVDDRVDTATAGAHMGADMWDKYGVTEDTRMLWTERLREWMYSTIIARLSKQIKVVNKRLARIGCEDMQIGEVSASTLKQLAITKSIHVPILHSLVPYLEISTNQTYVVKRIHDLAKGGCMSDYDWNGGGVYGKPWGENLPNDATLLAYEFCSYMDSRLPADAKYPDGKTFTNQHFIKTPDKPNLTKGDNLLLYQSKIHPPHFHVVVGDEIWPVQKGRNNLFSALLLFLYHIQVKEHGMLGRVNLGLSGINMLHVLDPKA